MKGFIARLTTVAGLAGSLALGGGCDAYRNVVDPCYPTRYSAQASAETVAAFAPQVNNGHVLDQTVWNYHFEAGTDKLTLGGLDHLAYLARRRPSPDGVVFLQTAQDLAYDPATPDKFVEARGALDAKRSQAIQNYLTAQTAGRHLAFEVVVHDPSDPTIAAAPAGISVAKMYTASQGVLPSAAGAGGASATGGGGAGGGK